MKFLSDIRLLILAIWLGAAIFFIAVAQSSFAVLPTRELAGSVVNRTLAILNYGGLAISVLLILTSLLGASRVNRLWLWVERVSLVILAGMCAVGQFVIAFWLMSIRIQLGRPIDDVAMDDPLRIQFNSLHEYSRWALFAGMVSALIAFLVIANSRNDKGKSNVTDIYDFQKEFKV